MSLERQILFWGLGLAALLLIVYLLGSTITPFAAGIVLGYLLDPVVLKLQKFGFNRLGASLLILTVFVLTVVLFFILVVPVLGTQFIAFAQHLPGYAVRLQAFAVEEGNAFIAKYGGRWLDDLRAQPAIVERANSEIGRRLRRAKRTMASRRVHTAGVRRGRAVQFPVAPDRHACRRLLYSRRLAQDDLEARTPGSRSTIAKLCERSPER